MALVFDVPLIPVLGASPMTADAQPTTADTAARCPALDYDFGEPSAALHGRLAELRGDCPVGWNAGYGGFWLLTRYADVQEAARDHEVYTTTGGIMIPPTGAS